MHTFSVPCILQIHIVTICEVNICAIFDYGWPWAAPISTTVRGGSHSAFAPSTALSLIFCTAASNHKDMQSPAAASLALSRSFSGFSEVRSCSGFSSEVHEEFSSDVGECKSRSLSSPETQALSRFSAALRYGGVETF
jgi:hypothetical protein